MDWPGSSSSKTEKAHTSLGKLTVTGKDQEQSQDMQELKCYVYPRKESEIFE